MTLATDSMATTFGAGVRTGSSSARERIQPERLVSSQATTAGWRQKYLTQFGDQPNSYFHLQAGVNHFSVPGVGFLTYFSQWVLTARTHIVFARPVCSDSDVGPLLDAFMSQVKGRFIFAGMDAATAELLRVRGFCVNEFGVDFTIPLSGYVVQGKEMKYLRTVLNNAKKGVEIRELRWDEVDGAAVERISNAWRGTKAVKKRELKLLTRPPQFRDEWAVRKFFCFKDGRVVGFVFFDPFFKDGRTIGYTANILRSEPDVKPRGILDFCILTAMDKFREEGVELVSLGCAPLHDIQPHAHERPRLRQILQFAHERGNALYSFKDLAFHKTRYRARETKLYGCVGRDSNDFLTVWAALRATNTL